MSEGRTGNGAVGRPAPAEVAAEVRAFLQARGCDRAVIERGMEGLIADWEAVADTLELGYPLDTLDDFLNDMDARQLIHDLLAAVPRARKPVEARLASADERARAQLTSNGVCLWGGAIATSRGWSAQREWWYFMRPSHPGPGLARDLGR